MKTEYYSSSIENEAIDALNFFKKIDENIPEKERQERIIMLKKDKLEILHFIEENEETEFNEFLKQYNEKYRYMLDKYREMKKVKQLTAIKNIAVYFFVISIVSILTGIIIAISALTQ